MIHLNAINLKRVHNIGTYPFNLPGIDDWEPLSFKYPVTILPVRMAVENPL
jgi:predicted ATPase